MKDLSKKTKAELISEIKALEAKLTSLRKKAKSDNTYIKDALDESNDLTFFKLAETLSSAILIYKKDSVCYVNKSASELTGYTKEEHLKMKFWDTVFPEDKEFVKNRGYSRLDGNKAENRYVFRILTKNNEVRWVEFAADMIIYEGEPAALGIVLDITERKINESLLLKAHDELDKTANKLKESKEIIEIEREQIEVTLRSIGDGLITTDFKGRIVILNKTAEELTGWSEVEAFGRHIDEVFHVINEYTRERVPTPIEQVLNTGQIVELANHTLLISKKDGSKRIISDSAAPIHGKNDNILGVVLVFRDNTDEKRKEEKLIENENMYRTLFEGANDAIFTMDGNQFISCNKKTTEIFKCHAEDIIGNFPYNFSPPYQPDGISSIESAKEKINNAYKGIPQFFEWKHSHLDGSLFDAEVGLNRFEINGKYYLQAIVRDITERKETAEEIKKSENLLRNIIELSNISMAIVSFDGIIEYINKQAVKTFGYQHKEIPNMDSWWVLAYPEVNYRTRVIDQWMGLINKAVAGDGEIERREYYTTCKDGSIKTMVIFGVIVGDKVFVMFEDITERKNAEELIKQSEEQFRVTFENAPIGMILTAHDGRLVAVNESFCKMLGYSKSEVKNFSFLKFTHPDDIESTSIIFQKDFKGEHFTSNFEKRYIHKDGHIIWVSISSSPFKDSDGSIRYMIAHIIDITDRKKAIDELKQSEDRYRNLVELSPEPIIVHTDGIIEYANKACIEVMKVSAPEEIIGKSALSFVNPEYRAMVIERIKNSLALGDEAPLTDEKFIRLDGETIDVEVTAIPFNNLGKRSMLTVFKDVTEIKRAQQKLINSEEQYRAIADNTKDMIVKYETDGKISYVSNACIDMLGLEPNELIGHSVFYFFHPDEIPRLRIYQERLLKQLAPNLVKHMLRKKDNTYIWCETSNQIIHDDKKNIKEVVAICRDISEMVRSEELIKEKEAAELANKAKSEFLANMSHEIRNPLNSIIGLTNLMSRAELNKGNKEMFESIKISSNNLLNIVNDLLDFSKIEANKIEIITNEFETQSVVKEIYQSYKSLTDNKKIDFSYKVEEDVPALLYGDSGKFIQIMNNLVGNAIKFTENGAVNIHISKIIANKDSITLKVEVSDTGIGIRKKDFNKVFQSFTQLDSSTSKSYPGTGLGLAIVKRYTELLNGNVYFASEFGKGSTFTIEIPFKLKSITKTKIKHETEHKSLSAYFSNKKVHVLLAEDDGINQLYLKNFLTDQGLTVDGVFDGKQALEKYSKTSYDIILMDGQMPKMDGFEATRLIREEEKTKKTHIPIIAITGYTISGDEEKFILSGMDDYITKPIDENKLLELIYQHTIKQ